MNDGPKRDWQKTHLHFWCGVVVGAAAIFSADGGLWAVVVGAAIIGLLAAVFLDHFWEAILRWWH